MSDMANTIIKNKSLLNFESKLEKDLSETT